MRVAIRTSPRATSGRRSPLRRGQAAAAGVLALLVCAAGARAEGAEWHGVRSQHFTFVGDEDPAALESMARALESMREALERLAPDLRLESPAPIVLYPFRDASGYAPFALPGAGAGYLLDHPHGVYGAFVGGREPTRKVYEQYLLLLLETNFPRLPPWLLHGLAGLYSTFEWSEEAVLLGLPNEDQLWLLVPLARHGELSLSEVVLGDLPADAAAAQPYLAKAWALTHYLLLGDPTWRVSLASYLEKVAAGLGPRRAFVDAFGGGPEIFEQPLAEYVQAHEHPALRITLGNAPTPLPVEGLDAAETLYRQGDLLLHALPRRAEAALDLFDRALELDPDLAPAWTASGHALEQLGRRREALDRYRRAVALAPSSYLAGALLGEGLLHDVEALPVGEERAARLDEAIRVLEACTRRRPEWLEAWTALGWACSLEPARPECAARATERALQLAPGRTDLLFNLLLARARRLDRDGVAELVGRLEHLGASELATRGREMELQLLLKEASEAMKEDRLADAVALLARVRAETTLPERRRQAEDWLERVAEVEQRNRFAERYDRAVELYRAGAFREAADLLRALAGEALPGLQQTAVRNLDRALEARAFERGVTLGPEPTGPGESGDRIRG